MYFLKKYKERMVVALVTIILLTVIGLTNNERDVITKAENLVGTILTPVSKITFSIGKNVTNFFSSIFDFVNVKEENDKLKEQVIALESEVRDLENIIGKTDYLRNEAAIQENTEHNIVLSQIVGKEPGNWYNRFTIDKGLKDGIVKGATVIQGIEIEQGVFQEGIVGRVVDVGNNWAKVLTIIDELNSISFKIIRTQDGGVLSGNNGTITGYLFDNKADVIVGDKLYTSGLGGTYKKDIYIGEVSDVESDEEELTKRITITPAINFKKIYKVFVIVD
ncbi:rod shape-determining protein MreC [Tissierella sp. Yu-01]|uniref:rod shape-determining protein MreC n=1 Tax=Tissierella sp. Yu-01 TaxID=3035694 RepID=UPI00240D8A6F|nr:rod shape-determining protein MreC [Tissierella sp. Yu-01]WFA09488.1 rod shape-determining protein MreC [Tissierella sp. Yu-01]